jgi:adenylosuccinate synthase
VLGRDLHRHVNFFEVSQGFSLGINSGFYPHVTGRECTVAQALADASVSPAMFQQSILSLRTYPIRVGNTENSSGPCYLDQREIGWDELGVTPETTTVTGRIRRIFTWSDTQFRDAVVVNTPSVIFLNFCNYLRTENVDPFVRQNIVQPYFDMLGYAPKAVLLGFGPRTEDIRLWEA